MENCGHVKEIYLWTLGTNWKWSTKNVERLRRSWRLFRTRVSTYQKRGDWDGEWKPLLYVVEVGKSGYLHIHVAVHGRLDQSIGRSAWSSIVEIDEPNFGYSPPNGRDPLKGMVYLAKYLSKGIYNWYWLGDMRKKLSKRYVFCTKGECGDFLYKYLVTTYDEIGDPYTFHMLPAKRGSWQKTLNDYDDI